jgi:DNA mismatch endonuclease, patch repair protein
MYVRDKRSRIPKNEAVSRVMSANRAKNTKPELVLRKALWQAGARGYRLHRPVRTRSGIDGPLRSRTPRSALRTSPTVRPDISFVSKKVAIFVNGCYWHRFQ